jgi:hypothetical protein
MRHGDFKEIPTTEYVKLSDPQFKGQSRPDNNGTYYTYWENEGELYRVKNNSINELIKDYLNHGLNKIGPSLSVDEIYNDVNAGLTATLHKTELDAEEVDDFLSSSSLTAPIGPAMVTDVYEHNGVIRLSLKKSSN